MGKDKLCINCAKCQKVNKAGYITCPEFKKVADAKACGMNIFLHCWGDCFESKPER